LETAPPLVEIVDAGFLRHARPLGGEFDRDHAVAVLERQRGVEALRDHLEGRGANGDGYGHREDADQRQRRIFDQHPHAQLAVERDVIEPLQRADVASRFFPLLDAAEGHVGLPARLDRIQVPLTNEPVGLHLDVEHHLLVHLGIEL
jgi:hypothetical protein